MKKAITEYVITYKNNLDEFISENKAETDAEFEATKSTVHQYFSKEWVYGNGDYNEGNVEVYYND